MGADKLAEETLGDHTTTPIAKALTVAFYAMNTCGSLRDELGSFLRTEEEPNWSKFEWKGIAHEIQQRMGGNAHTALREAPNAIEAEFMRRAREAFANEQRPQLALTERVLRG